MKTERTIFLKSYQLRKIRNNLRALWLAVAEEREFKLLEERKKVLLCHRGGVEVYLASLLGEINKIRKIVKSSICMCGWCHSSQKNMKFNISRNQWFCIECYNNICPCK